MKGRDVVRVAVDEGERATGLLDAESLEIARRAIPDDGLIVLDDAFRAELAASREQRQ